MHVLTSATWLGIAVLSLSGCGRAPRQAERTLLPADYQAARQAMSLKEVSLMLRNGYKDPAIIAEVTRRHVTEKPDAQTEAALVLSGSGPALIEALRVDANVLTVSQKEAYDELATQRAAEQARLAQQNQPVGECETARANAKTCEMLRPIKRRKKASKHESLPRKPRSAFSARTDIPKDNSLSITTS
jgi:hypothetical protein